MVVTFKNIQKVVFPVYKVGSSNWSNSDGLIFIEDQIVDDRNMPGNTIGIRRLQTPHKNLYKLNKKIDNLTGILKSNTNIFIDTKGSIFLYDKTYFSKLKYYRIKRIDKKETACLLWLAGIKTPFIIPRPPEPGILYAGVLHFHGLPWVLYEYSETKKKDTRRKV